MLIELTQRTNLLLTKITIDYKKLNKSY